MEEDPDLAIRCPRCHSTDIVFEHLAGTQVLEEDSDPVETEADEVESEAATSARKFDWTCASCGYKWEDDGVESK